MKFVTLKTVRYGANGDWVAAAGTTTCYLPPPIRPRRPSFWRQQLRWLPIWWHAIWH